MNAGRSILALVVALSVTLLPAASGAGVNAKPVELAGMSVMEDMPDCCPHEADPCEQVMDHCGTMATCALKCFSFVGTSAVITFPSASAKVTASFAASPFCSQAGSPPFRPPRG